MPYAITEIEDRTPQTSLTGRFRFSMLRLPPGLPVCELSYRTKEDAEIAREAALAMVAKACEEAQGEESKIMRMETFK